MTMPIIVCLCGSAQFYEIWQKTFYEEEIKGNIVLTIAFNPDAENHNGMAGITLEQKVMLDELHKRKIDLADEVLILNVNGYIGQSTQSELEYAKTHGKTIRFLEAHDEMG